MFTIIFIITLIIIAAIIGGIGGGIGGIICGGVLGGIGGGLAAFSEVIMSGDIGVISFETIKTSIAIGAIPGGVIGVISGTGFIGGGIYGYINRCSEGEGRFVGIYIGIVASILAISCVVDIIHDVNIIIFRRNINITAVLLVIISCCLAAQDYYNPIRKDSRYKGELANIGKSIVVIIAGIITALCAVNIIIGVDILPAILIINLFDIKIGHAFIAVAIISGIGANISFSSAN